MTAAPEAPQTLSLDHPGNVAALIANTFGHLPKNSAVIVGIKDGHSGGHLRVDLAPLLFNPSRLVADYGRPFFETAEAVGIYFITPDDPDPEFSPLYSEVYKVIADGFADGGLTITQGFQIGPTYARVLNCTDPACCDYPGELAFPEAEAAVKLLPENPTTPAEEFEAFTSTTASETFTAEVTDYCTDTTSFEGMEAVAALADGSDDQVSAIHVAGLLANLTHRYTPAVLALAFSGRDAAETAYDTGALPDTYGQAPDWARVDRITEALTAAVPHATAAEASYVHAAMAFIRHAQGRNSMAALHYAQAIKLNPQNTVTAAFSTEGISGWAQRKEDSYSYFKA